ncbi:hypothetical protein, partial [Enterobacter sp. PTB]|uniref:hypothetical protein n=1 Tax=Enterobacter sp. PTB TaxID=3143437 RepID=UPI003DA7F479
TCISATRTAGMIMINGSSLTCVVKISEQMAFIEYACTTDEIKNLIQQAGNFRFGFSLMYGV